jgi:hypothetical protein
MHGAFKPILMGMRASRTHGRMSEDASKPTPVIAVDDDELPEHKTAAMMSLLRIN